MATKETHIGVKNEDNKNKNSAVAIICALRVRADGGDHSGFIKMGEIVKTATAGDAVRDTSKTTNLIIEVNDAFGANAKSVAEIAMALERLYRLVESLDVKLKQFGS